MIWYNPHTSLRDLEQLGKDSMADFLGIEWVKIGDDFIEASMPVDERTRQPYGYLHGGASCVLAETLGSVASALVVNPLENKVLGLEINANHLRPVQEGKVTGTARPLHLGRQTHVWDIRICNADNKLVCISRLTVAIVPNR